jgi:hypothetical protein
MRVPYIIQKLAKKMKNSKGPKPPARLLKKKSSGKPVVAIVVAVVVVLAAVVLLGSGKEVKKTETKSQAARRDAKRDPFFSKNGVSVNLNRWEVSV